MVDLVNGRLGVGQLVALPTAPTSQSDTVPSKLTQLLSSFLMMSPVVKVLESPMTKSDFIYSLYCQLKSAALVGEIQ